MTTLEALPSRTADGSARATALAARSSAAPAPEAFVTYASAGHVLVVGPLETATAAAEQLGDPLDVRVLATDRAGDSVQRPDVEGFGPRLLRARVARVRGYLGDFRVEVFNGGTPTDLSVLFGLDPEQGFDLLLDVGEEPALVREKLPPGYYWTRSEVELRDAVAELPELVGEFDKPRYFTYDPEICVHGSRGQPGCTRCLDHCATEAIRSVGERIEVDPFLCQGCGSCATVCPTGAIGYTAPSGEALVDDLRATLRRYREGGGGDPVVLFHDGEAGATAVAAWAAEMPESVLPFEVEDVGGIGPDIWLAALAYGAGRVVLAVPESMPPSERSATAAEMAFVGEVLAGLDHPAERVAWVEIGGDETALADAPAPLVDEPATFAAFGGKRARMRQAITHLYRQGGARAQTRSLMPGAPLGSIEVDRDACTLCMACVSVCPTQAVFGGGERPVLSFREDRCVQCGLCERSCPEDAIRLEPRIDYARQAEPEERLLNEEEMHHCPRCGKAFATRKMIERMEQKLSGHWMFSDGAARARLQLCEDCRIEAVMRDEGTIAPYKDE